MVILPIFMRLIHLRFQVASCFCYRADCQLKSFWKAFTCQARVQSTSASFPTPLGRGIKLRAFQLFRHKKAPSCEGVSSPADGVDLLSHPLASGHTYHQLNQAQLFNFLGTKKAPSFEGALKSGVDLLSHPQKGSTISAIRLNFSVRNGKRWTLML